MASFGLKIEGLSNSVVVDSGWQSGLDCAACGDRNIKWKTVKKSKTLLQETYQKEIKEKGFGSLSVFRPQNLPLLHLLLTHNLYIRDCFQYMLPYCDTL